MKKLLLTQLFLLSLGMYSQNVLKINSYVKLSDSLTYETEVRIYQGGGTTNYSSLFRMFKDKSGKWTAEFYEHYAKVEKQTKLKIVKKTLKSENKLELIFQNLIRSHILDLPSLNTIQWKLVTRGNVEKVVYKYRDKEVEEYEFSNQKISILDGESFKVQINSWNRVNEFEFSNPDGYLKHYPEIDELIYMCEILNLIRTEFDIWKK